MLRSNIRRSRPTSISQSVTPPRIFLAHIGGQHASRLAAILSSKEWLSVFATGVLVSKSGLANSVKRYWSAGLFSLVPQQLIPSDLRKYWNHILWWFFDFLVSRNTQLGRASIVVGFENSALSLFRRARAKCQGIRCVLECPSVHHSKQVYGPLTAIGTSFVRAIDDRKNKEIELADKIIVLSKFAKQTFIDAGVPADKVSIIRLGVDTEFFSYRPLPETKHGIRFLFAGSATYWKGVDILFEAFDQIGDATSTLRFIGVKTPLLNGLLRSSRGATATGPIPRQSLIEEYAAAHILVLPSRFDGFGMVVSEAMSIGRPVIVSDHVGASDLVKTEGSDKSGWIVPADDAGALAEAMRDAIARREELSTYGRSARRAIESNSWKEYSHSIDHFYFDVAKMSN
jgi:glycosyltransferase involved in cell wall biosynthesis